MPICCGSQVTLCDLPIRMDNYIGCSHNCKYCFVAKKYDISKIEAKDMSKALRAFINGERNKESNWCDWNIPLHWGGMSDPFQPMERAEGKSYELLKIFAETQYPVVVSTKGSLITDSKYLELISQCNIVVQISMACSEYDIFESGAPKFIERLDMLAKLNGKVKRLIVRIQPYFPQFKDSVIINFGKYKERGVHGVIVESIKYLKKVKGTVSLGGDCVYPLNVLKPQFLEMKAEAHANGLKFYSGENRLRSLGDSLTCCGVDNMKDFRVNTFNLNHALFDKQGVRITQAMQEPGSTECFSALRQTTAFSEYSRNKSFVDLMNLYLKSSNRNIIG